MMKKRILLVLAAIILLLPLVMAGCQQGGIAQDVYDRVVAQLKDIQAKYTDAQTKYDELQKEKDAVEAQLQAARAEIADLQNQITGLQGENQLTGATLAETAEKIVKYYHETHVYSSYDLFVCSDMASEVWNMLKAQGISSVIVVGNKDAAISDILQSNHAWVLAKVEGGKDLALETTAGYSVPASQYPLYYRGWTFASPADLKDYGNLVREYNVRVGFRNILADEMNKANGINNTLYYKLKELKVAQETILNNIRAQINGLATVL
jgi:outer membrane murein-binding lipoprotein Lpp